MLKTEWWTLNSHWQWVPQNSGEQGSDRFGAIVSCYNNHTKQGVNLHTTLIFLEKQTSVKN